MTKQLLIYDRVVPLNRQVHRDTSVRKISSFAFAAEVNTVPIVDVEFARVALEAPVVFARTETGLVSLALMGTAERKNAFVGPDMQWSGRYIPAFLRRYPFVFSVEQGADRMTLCMDESFEGLNTENRGERMFDADGNPTTYLSTVLRFMEDYQATFNRTQAFCDRLEERDLLEEARIDYRLSDGTQGVVSGFLRVSAERLRALDDDMLGGMVRTGEMDLIQAHLLSLMNAESLVTRSLTGAAVAAPDLEPVEV
jgi:hypothetical protein